MKKITFIISMIIFLYSSLFAQSGWNIINPSIFSNHESVYFTDVNTGYFIGYDGSVGTVIKTTNAGINWIAQNPNTDFFLRSVYFTDMNTGFIAGANVSNPDTGLILKTTNGGSNWFALTLPVYKHLICLHFVNQNTGFVVGGSPSLAVILKTTNGGNSWVLQDVGLPFYFISVHFVDVNTGFVAGNLGRIIKTTNGGNNWSLLYTGTSQGLWGINFIDASTGVAVGGNPNNTSNVILRTSDGGNNWYSIPYTASTALLWSVRFVNSVTGYIVGWESNILKTTNAGLNWYNQGINPVYSSPVNYYLRICFFTSLNTGYIACELGVVLKTTDGGGPFVGVNPAKNEVPAQFYLYQNYPNPFNPVTKIKFDVPAVNLGMSGVKGVSVKLVIYDVLGREVTTLVNEQLNPGSYEVEWDAANYPSGVYYYKLTAGDFVETKKMILLK